MAMSEQEKALFHKNYQFMWDKLDTTYYHAKYSASKDTLPDAFTGGFKDVIGGELLPSYAICARCFTDQTYTPSKNTVKKIVHFYNENLDPPVDSWRFTHEDLSVYSDLCRKRGLKLDRRIIGTYWGLYITSANSGEPSGAILSIYEYDGTLRANLVAGIHHNDVMYHSGLEVLFQQAPVSQVQFVRFLKEKHIGRERLYFYEGTVEASARSVLILFRSLDQPPQKLVLTLDITDLPRSRTSYMGGLALALSTSDLPFAARFFQMGLISIQGSPIALSDPRLPDLLALQTNGKDCRIGGQDKTWYELAIRAPEAGHPEAL